MLKGQAKTDYQRNYMRRLRLRGKMLDPSVRPSLQPKTPNAASPVTSPAPVTWVDADGNIVYE